MSEPSEKTLFLCYGNPARMDDGLGAAFAAELERRGVEDADIEVDYQLGIEHALEVAAHERVVFVDASVGCGEPFSFRRIVPRFDSSFTTHSVQAEALMGLAASLFKGKATGYTLGIRGYEFGDFGERLSEGARRNLEAALQFALERLQKRDFEEADSVGAMAPTGCC